MAVNPSLADDIVKSLPVHTLVVAVNFPPFNDASAVTAMKRIIAAGELVDVVVQDLSSIRDLDDSLWEAVRPYVRHRFSVQVPPTFSNWSVLAAYVSAGVRALEAAWPCGLPYTRIRSRVMFPAAHFLAALLAARNGLSWTAEFSDPVRHAVDGFPRPSGPVPVDGLADELLNACPPGVRRALVLNREITSWCEFLPYGLASNVVFTNENQREAMLGSLIDFPSAVVKDIRNRSIVSPHPTLSREWYASRATPKIADEDRLVLQLGYFGVFYANRGVGEVVAAMASLPRDQRDRVKITIHTDKPSEVRTALSPYRLGNQLRVRPYLKYLDFLSALDSFDVLVVPDVQSNGYIRNPYLPSKLSDYRGSGVDIWGVVDSSSSMSSLTSDVLTYRTPLRDVPAARALLRDLIRKKADVISRD